jgi:hypothetical protein
MPKLTLPDGAVYETGDAVTKEKWDGTTVRTEVIKASDERRYTLSMGYPAYSPDVAVARDGHLDFASAAEVEKAAWGYLANGAGVGLYHADGTDGAGKIVESYIYRGPDWPQDSGKVIKDGDWLIGTIWSERAWSEIKAGEIRGTSMQGTAGRKSPSPADMAKVLAKRG